MWQEIFEIFEGQVPVEELKRRWKVQRDRYMKIRSNMKKKLPSGSSAAAKKRPNYKYYELMSFLDDSMDQRKTPTTLYYYRRRIITRAFSFKTTSTCCIRLSGSLLSQHCRFFTDARYEKQIIR
ncbi:hypothetical protein ALC62_10471 [Cyphomyrmex costatus]|uniref:MADF domain-containing protein n=1 Tax=Cyphomyrmex costatus TaxID=456900 RepID=A0A151IE17_9HYME|nr:hypothetical protein ALC62_10471 [Cyphomyrmex costatus]